MGLEGYVHGYEIDSEHSLYIYKGSLTRVQADALVSSDDNSLSAGGGVSVALAITAGHEVSRERWEIARQRRPRLGEVVRTSGGGLPCRYIYHAITFDVDRGGFTDEATLRKLIASLLEQATRDGVRSIGMPALATGVAGFDLGRAAEIIIDELLLGIVDTPIRQVILALIGDEAERLFYERLVRSKADRLASQQLRRRESSCHETTDHPDDTGRAHRQAGVDVAAQFLLDLNVDDDALPTNADPRRPTEQVRPVETTAPIRAEPGQRPATDPSHQPKPAAPIPDAPLAASDAITSEIAAAGAVIEQFPSLIDEDRLSTTPTGRPKLVEGLADLILAHADPADIERELLDSPACRSFRGTLKHRLMEFLYLSEDNLRTALGPALFKNKDLRQMLFELGENSDLPRDQDQLLVAILRALCFNTLAPPVGIGDYIVRLERLLADLRDGASDERTLVAVAVEAGRILEQALKDLLRMYGFVFFGGDFDAELVRRRLVVPRDDGNPISRLTIGQALQGLEQLNTLMSRDAALKARWCDLGRSGDELLPRQIEVGPTSQRVDTLEALREVIAARNATVHSMEAATSTGPDEMTLRVQKLHAFFCACDATALYPDVLRYEGTYENRNGERFVYFRDEHGRERKVRTDDKIDARRHYYCFTTNNPIHLHPVLIPKFC
jgi:O-acetyl-ADP-ribose deacetylase (regulator of RNase III)